MLTSITPGERLQLIYAKPGTDPQTRSGVVQAVKQCKNGHTVVTIFDEDKQKYRSFNYEHIIGHN